MGDLGEKTLKEEEKVVPDLSKDDQRDIKNLYHEASTLCHPDSAKCVLQDKTKAQEVFAALSLAYKAKDFEKVKQIHSELKSGVFNPENLKNSEMDMLRKRFAVLEHKYKKILNNLMIIKTTDPFLTITQLKDWDQFFNVQKVLLENQKEELELKYVKQ